MKTIVGESRNVQDSPSDALDEITNSHRTFEKSEKLNANYHSDVPDCPGYIGNSFNGMGFDARNARRDFKQKLNPCSSSTQLMNWSPFQR